MLGSLNRQKMEVGNIEWAFVDEGNGPTILLVHGFPLSADMWRFQIETLSKHFRVVAPDLPGYGSSRLIAPVTETSMEAMARELVDLLDAIGIEAVAFCGLSMGGYIGWQFWKQFPERLTHMIACDTKSVADTEEIARGRRILANGVLANGTRHIADAMIPRLFSMSTRQQQPEIVRAVGEVIASTAPETIARGHLAMAIRSDFSSQLDTLQSRPTLVVVGEHDEISTPAEMKLISEQLKNSEYLLVSGAGHMAPLEAPESVNNAISRFLNSTKR